MFANETTLRFSLGSPTDDRERAASLILGGVVDPRRIISHRLPLEQAPTVTPAAVHSTAERRRSARRRRLITPVQASLDACLRRALPPRSRSAELRSF
jgi:hypothetical protein